jgi:hypothetical protein
MFFLHTLDFADFTLNVIDVGALIFSGDTVEVCENVKMHSQFSPCLLRNKSRISRKCDMLKGHLQ